MLAVMTSPDAVMRGAVPDLAMVNALRQIRDLGHPVGLVSNHTQPTWFDSVFGGSRVQYLHEPGRQTGAPVTRNAIRLNLRPFDILVLAAKREDVAMGKNGGALLLGSSHASDPAVKSLGLQIDGPEDLLQVVDLSSSWSGQWYFSADAPTYRVRALSDLSTRRSAITGAQQAFALALTSTVKRGGGHLKALLAVTARSLLMEGLADESQLFFGAYPSSRSANDDSEVLSDFVHRLRTTVSQVRMAARGQPLFIRHTASSRRSAGGGGDRTDPTEQLHTVHLNPYYAEKGRLRGRHAVVVDDCTTYGVSFGVAAALLRAAGVTQMTGVALGKFGSTGRYYDINVTGNPFAPLRGSDYQIRQNVPLAGTVNAAAQTTLQEIVA